jgi:hypothetical protein
VTERKPAGTSWESWIEGQIRTSMERGDFDDLPGKGKPLPLIDGPVDDLWWVREKLRREDLSYLPPTLEVRLELDQARRDIAKAGDEGKVRDILGRINQRIRYVNSHIVEGPPSTLMPLDVEEELERWRQLDRPGPAGEPTAAVTVPAEPAPGRTRTAAVVVLALAAALLLAVAAAIGI